MNLRADLLLTAALALLSAPAAAEAPLPEPSSPEVEPEPPQKPAPRPEPRASELRFGLGSVLGIGIAPHAAVGLSADAGMRWPMRTAPFDGVSLSLGARWDPSSTEDVPWNMRAQVSTSRLLGTVAPCLHWWVLRYCALVEVGRLWGTADDESTVLHKAEVASPFFLATGGRFGIEMPFAPHVGLRVSADLLGTWTPVTITIEGQSAWTASRVVGGFEAGLYVFN